MNQSKAKSIRAQVYRNCQQTRHPFPRRVYQKVKKLYLATPWNLRHQFNVRTGGVV